MWGQLSTTCSNVLKQPNGELLVAVNHNRLRTMASKTEDPIYWSHPPPSWAVPPECHVHSINRCNLSGTRTCNRSMQGNHLAYAATQGIKMTSEKHLRSVSRAASQRLGILRKSWRVFHDRSFLGRCFRGFILPVLEYCSAVWCSAADTHLKLLDRAVSGARLLTGGVFECDISHRRSVAVLCMLYKIRCTRCTLFMVLYLDRMSQRGLHAVLWSHIGTLMHRLAADPCGTAGLLFPSLCPSGTILLTPYRMVWAWRVSRAGPMLLYWPKLLYPHYSLLLFIPLSSFCL